VVNFNTWCPKWSSSRKLWHSFDHIWIPRHTQVMFALCSLKPPFSQYTTTILSQKILIGLRNIFGKIITFGKIRGGRRDFFSLFSWKLWENTRFFLTWEQIWGDQQKWGVCVLRKPNSFFQKYIIFPYWRSKPQVMLRYSIYFVIS